VTHPHTIILEDASLELVPKKFWTHEACRLYEARFGIPPESQILDDNFHHAIIEKLHEREKKGRPDVVHFALLDIMSTPAYEKNFIQPIIHTLNKATIVVRDGVRPPRTELRFNGVMSKILRGDMGPAEERLFAVRAYCESRDLVKSLKAKCVFCLSTQGVLGDLRDYVAKIKNEAGDSTSVWIVGGFARGHLSEEVKSLADEVISISDRPLPAHVVTARLSYEIERSLKLFTSTLG
jgi:rRNA small subunit pseudouridine methyltransferase Nep1